MTAPFVSLGASGIPALDKAALLSGRKVRLSAMRVDGGHLRGWRMIAG